MVRREKSGIDVPFRAVYPAKLLPGKKLKNGAEERKCMHKIPKQSRD